MKIDKLLELVQGAERIPPDLAEELLGFGITDFLVAGCGYTEALDLLAKAEISLQRQKYQGL